MGFISDLLHAVAKSMRCSPRDVQGRLLLGYIAEHDVPLPAKGEEQLRSMQFRLMEALIDQSGRIDAIGLANKVGVPVSQAIAWIMQLGEQGRLDHLYAWHNSGYSKIIVARQKYEGSEPKTVDYSSLIHPVRNENSYDPRASREEPTLWQMADQVDEKRSSRRGRPEGTKYRLSNKRYKEAQSLLPEKIKSGRPPIYPRKQIIEALLYRARTGCTWESLPSFFPPWRRVYNTLWRWKRSLSGCKRLLHWIEQFQPT